MEATPQVDRSKVSAAMSMFQEVLKEQHSHEQVLQEKNREIVALKLEITKHQGRIKQLKEKTEVLEKITKDSYDGMDEDWLFRNAATVVFKETLDGMRRIAVRPRRGTPAIGSAPEKMKGSSLFLRALDHLQDRARGVSEETHATKKRSAQERQAREDEARQITWRRRPGLRSELRREG